MDDQTVLGPPMKVRASGTCPLNSAPLKSNPGFSSWNRSRSNFFLSYSSCKGLSFSWPWKMAPHLTPFWAFCTSRTNSFRPVSFPFQSFFSWMYQQDYCESAIPLSRCERYGGVSLNPTDTEEAVISILSAVAGLTPGGTGGNSMKQQTVSSDSSHSYTVLFQYLQGLRSSFM